MMKLEDICCSLELAKKIKEMSIKQESLIYWYEHRHGIFIYPREYNLQGIIGKYSAFTASELLNILGSATWKNLLLYGIPNVLNEHRDFVLESSSFPDALSKILIHLIESKLTSVEEINERI